MRGPRTGIDWRSDSGQVAGIEVLPFGILTFVIGMLLVVNAWAIVDADLATTSAAREAVRAYVEAPDGDAAPWLAIAAASNALTGHGRATDASSLSVTHDGDQPWGRCTRITITVRHPMPALRLPVIGGFGHAFDVIARQSEIIDPYRSGLPGEARC
jgi:hypothetical protein